LSASAQADAGWVLGCIFCQRTFFQGAFLIEIALGFFDLIVGHSFTRDAGFLIYGNNAVAPFKIWAITI
jgi:hypothetical protein